MMDAIIRPGDKLEIRVDKLTELDKNEKESNKFYKSAVEDVLDDGTIEIDMPIEGGRVILLPLDLRYDFIFFCKNVMYRARGVIKERYRRDNIYILRIELKTQLSRFQRREYYRYKCLMDIYFAVLTEDEWKAEELSPVYNNIRQNEKERLVKGRVLDLSGGGMRFTTVNSLEGCEYLLIIMRLANKNFDKQYVIASRLIESSPVQDHVNLYQNRIKFKFNDLKAREEIIRFIFEEERNLINKNTQ